MIVQRRSRGSDIDGILLLDKPCGFSSNDVLQRVKRLLGVNKAGYAGTLDPIATGMLPICLGEATKFVQYLLNADKRYLVTAILGKRTDTADAEGHIISTKPVILDQEKLENTLHLFRGEIMQVPSMFSAIKYKGRPLYKYARKGLEVARESRLINIYYLNLIHWNLKSISLDIYCSKGTYIRTLIDDIGEKLGCSAYVTALRRLNYAQYQYQKVHMITLEALQEAVAKQQSMAVSGGAGPLEGLLLPIDSAIVHMPKVTLSPSIAALLRLGQTHTFSEKDNIIPLPKCGLVRMMEGEKFFGIGEMFSEGLVPRRLISKQT